MRRWISYKNNPHIQYNEQTRMFRCSTCNIDLNNNPGGAGKHSTKIHNVALSGKPIPKVEKNASLQFTIEDVLEEIIDNRKIIEQKIEKLEGKVDAVNAKIDEVKNQYTSIADNYHNLDKIVKRTRQEQNGMKEECISVNERFDGLMTVVKMAFLSK